MRSWIFSEHRLSFRPDAVGSFEPSLRTGRQTLGDELSFCMAALLNIERDNHKEAAMVI